MNVINSRMSGDKLWAQLDFSMEQIGSSKFLLLLLVPFSRPVVPFESLILMDSKSKDLRDTL